METRYEEEINLAVILFKICKRWRILVITTFVFAIAIGGTRLAINLQGIADEARLEKLKTEYQDTLAGYEAEGETLKLAIEENQRNLKNQTDYNDGSLLMKIDPQNEWNGSVNFYIDAGYQIMPNSSVQNENPAYQILYAYADYYQSGEFYTAVMSGLSFDLGEQKYLREILTASFNAGRYAFTLSATADTEEHCREMLNLAVEAFRSRYEFVENILGKHKLTSAQPVVYARVNTSREDFQKTQKANEKTLLQNVPELNKQYRDWEERGAGMEAPMLDAASAVKGGLKWIILGGVLGFIISFVCLSVKTLFSGRIRSADDCSAGTRVLAELPAAERRENVVDRFVCRIFGVTMKASEYDSRVKALTLSLAKLLEGNVNEGTPCGTAKTGDKEKIGYTVALVGDIDRKKLEAFAGQVRKALPDGYEAVAAGNLIADGEAAETAYGADAVLLVAEQDVSVKKSYAQINDRLHACKMPVLGTVLLGVESL